MKHDFKQKLEFSLGSREQFDKDMLLSVIPGCVDVRKTDVETDKTGVDYIATLRKGAEIYIDAKAREPGARRFWKGGPELALEKWSVVPTGTNVGKAGWTLSESTPVDMILYTFDRSDCDRFFLLPFQFLRMAFIRHIAEWGRKYGWKEQSSGGWRSMATFVPADVVLDAIAMQMVRE